MGLKITIQKESDAIGNLCSHTQEMMTENNIQNVVVKCPHCGEEQSGKAYGSKCSACNENLFH